MISRLTASAAVFAILAAAFIGMIVATGLWAGGSALLRAVGWIR